jgi:hypothetical protein
VLLGVDRSTYGPTEMLKEQLAIANKQLGEIRTRLEAFKMELSDLTKALIAAGAPAIEGEVLPE